MDGKADAVGVGEDEATPVGETVAEAVGVEVRVGVGAAPPRRITFTATSSETVMGRTISNVPSDAVSVCVRKIGDGLEFVRHHCAS